MNPKPVEACLIVTYRCNARCAMCDIWRYPSVINQEFSPAIVNRLPNNLRFINITGGEPFLRSDLDAIIDQSLKKADRVVISTNGSLVSPIFRMAEIYGNKIGIRISIEGLCQNNDRLRGLKGGFQKSINLLKRLKAMQMKDIGIAVTLADDNAQDLVPLYHLTESMKIEFATAVTHNSFYFHKYDNCFRSPDDIALSFEKLAFDLLRSNRPKNWFRAYFNMGLVNKVRSGPRPLDCRGGSDIFFIDPFGNVLPCNGSDGPMIMGNLLHQSFDEIWHSESAKRIRKQVHRCTKQCWMIGTVAPAMKRKITTPTKWIVKNKLKLLLHRNRSVPLDPVV